MTYYRLAVQDRQSTHWTWKTTAVTSLQAVFQVLRIYAALPQDDIRVFTASSKEELREMLSRQNNQLESGSVTATQFLQERNIAGGKQLQNALDQRVSTQTDQQETEIVAWATRELHKSAERIQQESGNATWAKEVWEKHRALQTKQKEAGGVTASPLHNYLTTMGTLSSLGMSFQEKKRLEIELGSGGDHDLPYLFTLPITQKERLAWIRLQKQVQAGELLS
jgi:hypothetical protein